MKTELTDRNRTSFEDRYFMYLSTLLERHACLHKSLSSERRRLTPNALACNFLQLVVFTWLIVIIVWHATCTLVELAGDGIGNTGQLLLLLLEIFGGGGGRVLLEPVVRLFDSL